MISKLCDYGPRNDFIIKVIRDLLEEMPESQIMVLAHNRSLLTYFHDSIQHHGIATVGYYVGGMKQKDLQETESKQIVLATYAMAAEALDIKTLSTLVMATPKTDITQSVGRILRMKHEKPIVVDIVDTHELFQNQWKLRKRFYKKCNYRIRSIDSKKYKGMNFDWDKDATWLRVFEPKVICSSQENDNDNENSGSDNEKTNVISTVFGGKCVIDIEGLE
jgi:superfamily II DNA or RNA helicase